ncbi:lysophospholipid acyltransferase family protein [Methylobacterium sp. Leaf118]|uniref:lysophospholipid acyltransferase family protein n=1 Tax=Methylobacterium sp. Leaf118 TaxID=2876562 RepID=UPI001E3A89CB|nr:lysophospholipid acyltransferase family protein [Methylobacterium sp. Leaf118]
MAAYFDRFVRRHMNALRLARWGVPAEFGEQATLVVYCNHPAWWDAAILILLGRRLFPDRECFAPFDAAMLEKYGIFRRMGAFPVDLESRRGAVQFLSASRAVLSVPGRTLWVTAQGRFADVRARPLGLRPGIAHLPEIAPEALFVPLALDYAFWEERGAEACCAFGTPIPAAELRALPRPERLARLEAALTGTLDRLAADVIARDPARFETLVSGRRGVGGIYDGWRRLGAALTGRRFEAGHRRDDIEGGRET